MRFCNYCYYYALINLAKKVAEITAIMLVIVLNEAQIRSFLWRIPVQNTKLHSTYQGWQYDTVYVYQHTAICMLFKPLPVDDFQSHCALGVPFSVPVNEQYASLLAAPCTYCTQRKCIDISPSIGHECGKIRTTHVPVFPFIRYLGKNG